MKTSTIKDAADAAVPHASTPGWWTPLQYEDFKSSQFFPSLDGLRAIAVLLVIFVHYGGSMGEKSMGWLGVQAFFVLSGFLITTLLLRENETNGSVSLGRFYLRRAFRIMPVYYAILAVVVWQSYRLGGESWDQMSAALPYYLTFLNEQTDAAPWKLSWTLGIEWKFYLVWPFLAFFVARSTKSRLALGFSLLAALVLVSYSPYGPRWLNPTHYGVLLMGALLAILLNERRGFLVLSQLTRPAIAVAIFLAFFLLQARIHRLSPKHEAGSIALVYAIAVVLLLVAILGPGLPRKILSSRPLVFVGQRSYSLYLLQILASQAVTGWAPWREHGLAYTALTFVTGLILADVMLRYLERPMIAFGRRVEAGLKNRTTARAFLPI
jgi:peptidoglycan/LPS O-acetylase OafA/YrhL